MPATEGGRLAERDRGGCRDGADRSPYDVTCRGVSRVIHTPSIAAGDSPIRPMRLWRGAAAAVRQGAAFTLPNSLNIPRLSGAQHETTEAAMLAKGLLWTAITLALTGLPEGARAQGDQPTLLGTYVDWAAYTATPGGKKVCFALSKPKTSTTNPPG